MLFRSVFLTNSLLLFAGMGCVWGFQLLEGIGGHVDDQRDLGEGEGGA